jgi:hypothetical protein
MTGHSLWLTEPYTVYLAAHDVDLTLPVGTEFVGLVSVGGEHIGWYQDPKYGAISVITHDATDTPVKAHQLPPAV